MAKLGQQLKEENGIQQTRPTRTERVAKKQEFQRLKNQEEIERQRIEFENKKRLEAVETISQADYENYEEKYNSIDPNYREGILTPTELKNTEGYKKYQVEKQRADEIGSWNMIAEAYKNRNKPFALGLNPDQSQVKRFAEFKKAMLGQPSTVPQYVIDAYKGQMPTEFSTSQRVYGLDVGETRTIVTKDKATGEIKKYEEFKKVIDPETKKPVIMFGSITGKEIKQIQIDAQLKEFEEQQKNAPKTFPFKLIPAKDLPLDYGGQQSISSEPRNILVPDSVYYADRPKTFDFGLSKVVGGVKSGFKWIDERVHFDLSGSPSYPKATISFGKKDKPTFQEAVVDVGVEKLGDISENLRKNAIDNKAIEQLDLDLEKKYSGQYQQAFDTEFGRKIIKEEISFDEASKQFEESKEAKIIQKKYQEEYETEYKKIDISTPLGKKLLAGSGRTGLNLASFGLKAVRSPTRVVTTAGAVYTGVKVLSLIPPAVTYAGTGGLFAYGTYKAFSPTSTIDEAGSGLITAVLSGVTLGYGAYRYLRSPVVKTVDIKPPKTTLKSSEVIGKDLKIVTKAGTKEIVAFPKQKLSQLGVAGRRTVVTSKGKFLFEKYTGVKLDPIYRGIPTQQLGKATTYTSLRGSYTIRSPSGYQKAFSRLTDYGYTSSQAKATLRFYAPKVIDQTLSKGFLTIKGETATGEFTFLKEQKVFDVDKALGIKTRGAKSVEDIIKIERKIINVRGTKLITEQQIRFNPKSITGTRAITFSKGTDLKQGYDFTTQGDFKVFTKEQYRDLFGVSIKDPLKIQISKKGLLIDYDARIVNIDTTRTKLLQKTITESMGKKYIGGKKTPFSKTFTDEKTTDLIIKTINKQKPINVQKIVNQIENVGSPVRTPSQAQSQFYGTGQYERSVGGLFPQQAKTIDLQQQLRSAVSFDNKLLDFGIKDLIKVKQLDLFSVGSKVGQLTAIKTASGIKTDLKLKELLKEDFKLRSDLKTEIKVKSSLKTNTLLKSDTLLKTQLKSLLGLDTFAPPIQVTRIPSFPKPPVIKPPIPKPFVFFLPSAKGGRSQKELKKLLQEKAYLPDFTSRALGLEPEIISEKQAQAKLKKLLTGLEVRRGVIIK